MGWHGVEAGMVEEGERRGGGGVGDGRDPRSRSRSRSRSPTNHPRKRRAVAADLFEDDEYDRDQGRQHRTSTAPRRNQPPREDCHHIERRKHRDQDSHSKGRRHHSRRSKAQQHQSPSIPAAELPFQARQLSYKHDYDTFTALFAYYLDIQKNLDFYALDSHEARGRWKSFVKKWNRAELAEGWYDPEVYERITRENPVARDGGGRGGFRGESMDAEEFEFEQEEREGEGSFAGRNNPSPSERREGGETAAPRPPSEREDGVQVDGSGDGGDGDDDVDDYGPPPPPGQSTLSLFSISSGTNTEGPRQGPGIPTRADLALQHEADREAAAEAASSSLTALRLARKADRAQQKERLDELVPRAEPGTRERQLEKKALLNEKMRSFRDNKGGGDTMEEVDDGELMGGGGANDLAAYKRMLATQQRKKTERELRREAEARAKAVEREERLREWKAREEEKLRGLKELARARFG